jgi:hypothetical protein
VRAVGKGGILQDPSWGALCVHGCTECGKGVACYVPIKESGRATVYTSNAVI